MKNQSSENKLVITEEFIFDQNKLSKDPNNHFNCILQIETPYQISEMRKLSLLNHTTLFVELCQARIFVILNYLVGLICKYVLRNMIYCLVWASMGIYL